MSHLKEELLSEILFAATNTVIQGLEHSQMKRLHISSQISAFVLLHRLHFVVIVLKR